ncbi:MAG: neutral zinc metallopeptidase [Mycobacteriales bacterium]
MTHHEPPRGPQWVPPDETLYRAFPPDYSRNRRRSDWAAVAMSGALALIVLLVLAGLGLVAVGPSGAHGRDEAGGGRKPPAWQPYTFSPRPPSPTPSPTHPPLVYSAEGNSLYKAGAFPAQKLLTPPTLDPHTTAEFQAYLEFVGDDVQQVWSRQFAKVGLPYRPADVDIWVGDFSSPCGKVDPRAMYCGKNRTVYFDADAVRSYQAAGIPVGSPVFLAVMVAHELGHHMQDESGIGGSLVQRDGGGNLSNPDSIRFELQADCFGGIWAHTARDGFHIDQGTLDQVVESMRHMGDDPWLPRPQWRHGSGQHRADWFLRGYTTGDPAQCNTFTAADAAIF